MHLIGKCGVIGDGDGICDIGGEMNVNVIDSVLCSNKVSKNS